MKYFVILALVSILVSFAFTTIEAACADQAVYNTCLNTRNSAINNCPTNDYPCLCQGYKDKQDCYADCPDDSAAQGDALTNAGQVKIYCQLVTTSSAVPSATPHANTAAPAASPASSSSSSPSSTPSSSSAKNDANWVHIAKELVFVPVFVAATFFMLK